MDPVALEAINDKAHRDQAKESAKEAPPEVDQVPAVDVSIPQE